MLRLDYAKKQLDKAHLGQLEICINQLGILPQLDCYYNRIYRHI